jgi:hypothetical protein
VAKIAKAALLAEALASLGISAVALTRRLGAKSGAR